jgi:hypothetical protein
MSERRPDGQTLIELLILLLPVVLSFVLGRIFFRYIGWWAVLPGVILGFGSVAFLFYVLIKFFPARNPRGGRSPGA